MIEPIGIKIARLEERMVAAERKVDEGNVEILRRIAELSAQSALLKTALDEWRGVRKMLAAMAALIAAISALAGGAVHYFSQK